MKSIPRLSALALLIGLVACGKKGPAPAATADAAMNNAIAAINKNDPSGIWHMLPASYQSGLNEALHTFAGKMDAELWEGATGILTKVEKILRSKKSMLLSMPEVQGNKEAADHYDSVVAVLSAITKSDLMDLNKLKKADIGKILGTTGSAIMKEASGLELPGPAGFAMGGIQELKNFKAELVSESGDTAMVKVTQGDSTEEIECVRLEGKWLPVDMADDLPGMIKEATEAANSIDFTTPEMAAGKAQALAMFGMVNGVLDQLENAETEEEVQSVMQGLLSLAGMSSSRQNTRRTSPKNACIENLRMINGASQQYMIENRTDTVPALDDPDFLIYFQTYELPVCPAGGTYIAAPDSQGVPTCTLGATMDSHKL